VDSDDSWLMDTQSSAVTTNPIPLEMTLIQMKSVKTTIMCHFVINDDDIGIDIH